LIKIRAFYKASFWAFDELSSTIVIAAFIVQSIASFEKLF